ncbi:NAD(P)H-dependent FMN reductase [Modicisalibacter muralis]|uniref:NAD(P)H-dependent FMN reductase n=1 Tax=Modicisalibacter muralis TaxID=119000 RepID=A0A1G9I3J4_9GAMM|nr:NAD(P)H-dependent oxidoreductase [Halomonas muralis]SDL19652.1 NAD(P)H-dependent FMN reductase [Halomonas muralis]
MHRKINVALIYGSTREGRFCDKVANWATTQIDRHDDFDLQLIDPALVGFPTQHVDSDDPEWVSIKQRMAEADAFIVVTPEYNHGYPAALKCLIDSFKSEWQAKPVAFVSYGGGSGGTRAVEQLRLVFAELHAVAIRDAVSFASVWEQFDTTGELLEPQRARKGMATLLARLSWWATALHAARRATPYEQVVA